MDIMKLLLCDVSYIELFIRIIWSLNNLIVLTELFPTPDYMCVCVCVCVWTRNLIEFRCCLQFDSSLKYK